MRRLMAAAGARQVVDAVDLGCSTGLSALELSRNFHDAAVTALDLSPTFLAVAAFLRRTQRTVLLFLFICLQAFEMDLCLLGGPQWFPMKESMQSRVLLH